MSTDVCLGSIHDQDQLRRDLLLSHRRGGLLGVHMLGIVQLRRDPLADGDIDRAQRSDGLIRSLQCRSGREPAQEEDLEAIRRAVENRTLLLKLHFVQ